MPTGILAPIDFTGEVTQDFSAFVRSTFVNDAPFVSRVPRERGKAEKFTIIGYNPRGRALTVGTGGIDNAVTVIPIADSTSLTLAQLQIGDVLRLTKSGGTEDVEVTATPWAASVGVTVASAGTVKVKRAQDGTSATAFAAADAITLVGNSRDGTEVDQVAQRSPRNTQDQYHQRYQFPVQVGDRALDVLSIEMPDGYNVLSMERESKLVEMVRDIEYTSYYGKGGTVAAHGDRMRTKGLRQLIDSANVVTAPTNAGAYTPNDLIRDLFQGAFTGGGNPDMVFCSTGFMGGLFKWGYGKQQVTTRVNTIGVPISGITVPFVGRDVMFVPALQLGTPTSHAAFAVQSDEVKMSYLRPETWKPRGSRGDATEGDWTADMAVKLINPSHHSWVENITAFAA